MEITNITRKEINGGVTEKSKSYTATIANFDIGFTQPGDYVIYDIEVTNSGTLDAVISNINVVTDNNPAIIYTTSGLKKADTIAKNGEKKYLTVKIEYDSNITSQPQINDNDITIQIDYQQDLGQVASYNAYVVGDTVEFAGSNWRVIKNSTEDEDYVTLMKETILTNSELGTHASTSSSNTMNYYEDEDTCYVINNDTDPRSKITDCKNSYETSKVKFFLENIYINTLGAPKLKYVEGYKIRLITANELNENLGWSSLDRYASEGDNTNVPAWVYTGFGEEQNDNIGYWTMTPSNNRLSHVRAVRRHGVSSFTGSLYEYGVYENHGVRPVINLLKSSIE